MKSVCIIHHAERAAALLQHPLRCRILAGAREPVSASELARRMDEPRQRLNYHFRRLAAAAFLLPADRRMRRNLEERRYVASAQAYLLAPDLLGPVALTPEPGSDRMSAAHLLALGNRLQSELGAVVDAAGAANVRVRTLGWDVAVRFESAAQRASFAAALMEAVSRVVAEHSAPSDSVAGERAGGQPFRLVVGCYPVPATSLPATPRIE